jgi:hypothetical protein
MCNSVVWVLLIYFVGTSLTTAQVDVSRWGALKSSLRIVDGA